MIVIIGAGLAGLTCAKSLSDSGFTDFLVLDAGAAPGGRVATEPGEGGYQFDRGFQVVLDSYPSVQRHVDIKALEPRYFDSGALLADPAAGKIWPLLNPLKHTIRSLGGAVARAFPVSDKSAIASIGLSAMRTSDDELLAGGHDSALDFLRHAGVTDRAIERFFQPFFGGVLLDAGLETSSALLLYYLKQFATGRAFIPSRGMAEFPRQLASTIPANKIRPASEVTRIITEGRQARAVLTTTGDEIAAEAFVLAADPWSSAALLNTGTEPGARGTTTLYFALPASLYPDRLIVLPATRGRLVQHFVQLTNINPSSAPARRHLVSATILGVPAASDEELFATAKQEIAAVFPDTATLLEPLRAIRVPRAVPLQPPGFQHARVIQESAAPRNVALAGDHTTHASIEGAMSSGEAVAAAILESVR